jgi:polar amino acid transport system substrate-binding protein
MTQWNWKNTMTFVAGAAIAAAAAISPAKAITVKEIQDKGTLIVGSLVDYPPFGLIDSSGQAVGYDPELAKEFADSIGVKLQITPVTSANRIQYLQSGQVDCLFATLGITEERLKIVDFSVPYAGLQQFVYGDVNIKIADKSGLAGQTIGVTRGNTQDTAVTAIAAPDTTIRRFDDDAASTQALLSGQVPLLGVADLAIEQIEKAAPGRFDKKFLLRQQAQGIVFRKDSADLRDAVSAFLNKKKQDGSLSKLHQKWMGSPLPEFIESAAK